MKKITKNIFLYMIILVAMSLCACGGDKEIAIESEVFEDTDTIIEETEDTIVVKDVDDYDIKENIEDDVNNGDKLITETSIDEVSGYNQVEYGKYWQWGDAIENPEMDSIYWLVIRPSDGDNDEYILVSRDILYCTNFNEEEAEVSFDDASIYDWLNDYFYNLVFNNEEKKYLADTSDWWLDSTGKISLLNKALIEDCFGKYYDKLRAKATDVAKGLGLTTDNKGYSSYYLIDNGESKDTAMYVGSDGKIHEEGEKVNTEKGNGIRPLIILKKGAFSEDVRDQIRENDKKVKDDVYK